MLESFTSMAAYPWPSTVNFASFVTVKPWVRDKERSSFNVWKEQMLCLLESQEVVGFVDGRILPPDPDQNEDEQKVWRRTDRLVKGWILGSIGNDTLDAVWQKETARDVWVELDNIFNRKEADDADSQADDADSQNTSGDLSSKNLALYKAAQRGDWDTAQNLFRDYTESVTAIISSESETALHVAVRTGKANDFVKKMVELMPRDALALKDSYGNTALHHAAAVGNTEAAKALINKNPGLPYILNSENRPPVLLAATYCHKGTLEYLMSKSQPLERQLGVLLLNAVIASHFFDVALDMVHKYPNLALSTDMFGSSALKILAIDPTAFLSRESFTWWQRLIYCCIPIQKSKHEAAQATYVAGDIENTTSNAPAFKSLFQIICGARQKLVSVVWEIILHTVPQVRDKKAGHQQALELVKYLCQQLVSLPEKEASSMLKTSMFMAAEHGISEIVEVIMDMYPKIIFYGHKVHGGTIFHVAVTHRFENIFNLIYSMSDRKYLLYNKWDNQKNNLMHICGKLAPPDKLNLVPGAALQMQRELQWFKEMERFVHPSRRIWHNKNKQTPKMLFTNEHQQLKAEGERWMKDTANACTIAAALIATVVFAAAFTVPGGIANDTGVPIFSQQPAFILFAISDALSLFTSITSLLMFLSILTSRYAEEDFLRVLPKRLSIGLLSLFISITFMLAAFSATMYLIFRGKLPWFLIPVAAFASLPVASFVLLQFPLLVDVVYSTYGPGIFGKKSGRVLY